VPPTLASGAVGSYPTVSPLPGPHPSRGEGLRRSLLCGTFQRSLFLALVQLRAAPWRAACPVESGLSSPPARLRLDCAPSPAFGWRR